MSSINQNNKVTDIPKLNHNNDYILLSTIRDKGVIIMKGVIKKSEHFLGRDMRMKLPVRTIVNNLINNIRASSNNIATNVLPRSYEIHTILSARTTVRNT